MPDSAGIRELHVFGSSTGIGKQGELQHKGIGKQLLQRAEEIAADFSMKRLVVISGIGAREYYRMLGYRRKGIYMAKRMD